MSDTSLPSPNQMMETLATVVFERTPLGAVVMKSSGEEVPRRLRTLLLAVDGRSPVSQYVPFLTAFAPLSDKFFELEKLGYLRRRGHANGGAAAPSVMQPTLDVGATAPDAIRLDESALTAFAASLHVQKTEPVTSADSFSLELQALSRQIASAAVTVVTTKLPEAGRIETVESTAATPLTRMLLAMQEFLSTAAGLDGLPVAMMLEQIRTLEQLRRELPAYRELVQPYGQEAEAHLAVLAQMLDDFGA